MEGQQPSYHWEFLRSPHHVVFACATLGVGFISAQLLPLILGATLYTLGWVYLPDMAFFRRWVDRRRDATRRATEQEKLAQFMQRREVLLRSLPPESRERYNRLALVCRDIENASADSPLAAPEPATDPRLRKLDELMWTYLRLLGIESSLQQFLEIERREKLPDLLQDAQAEVARLSQEVDSLKATGRASALDTKQRFLNSRLDRLDVLRKRQQRNEQAEANLALVVSEQERLNQQIKLLRADAVATKNAETLTARIDATVEHLDQTNKWISELDEFKDLVGDMPPTEQRVGYTLFPAPVPPIISQTSPRRREASRQRQC